MDGEDRHYLCMEAAILWGDSPFDFYRRPEVERAMMIAHYRERGMRKSHLNHAETVVSEKHAKKGKAAPSGPDQHAAFFNGG